MRRTAVMLGFVPRCVAESELLSWRQDWGARSIHPLAREHVTVGERRGRAA